MRVLLFTKFPQPGMVKTRLARTIGSENAAKLQQSFIEDELHMLTSIGAHTTLYCDPFRPLSDYERLFGPGFTYRTQQGRDIGERMLSALHQTLAETGEPVVLMGSDLPDLPDLHLGEAFAALRTAQVCLGPATDGGFYLLGLRAPLPDGIFHGVAWGGSGVLRRTLDNCASAGLTCLLLPPWPDVDTAADLADYAARNRNKKTRSMDTIRALGLMGGKMEALIGSFLMERSWVPSEPQVSFLAAGEYNRNFLVRTGNERHVFRINHGSQLGLDDQIGYEFKALRCVAASQVTPLPLRVHSDPEPFGGGVLLMQYLPGAPLVYERDWERAAQIFARIHALPPCPDLLTQEDPVAAIASESLALIRRYPDHALTRQRGMLLDYHERIVRLGEENRALFAADRLCVVNTEVNSGNFLVSPEAAYLVDWEKAVVSSRHQDLGHFLAPTTTLWKTSTLYSPDQKQNFLKAYHQHLPDPPALGEIMHLCRIMEQVIILRGLSWSFMAHHEYANATKSLTNDHTREKIGLYMRDMDRLIPAAF